MSFLGKPLSPTLCFSVFLNPETDLYFFFLSVTTIPTTLQFLLYVKQDLCLSNMQTNYILNGTADCDTIGALS
jgi:hypothetical protein